MKCASDVQFSFIILRSFFFFSFHLISLFKYLLKYCGSTPLRLATAVAVVCHCHCLTEPHIFTFCNVTQFIVLIKDDSSTILNNCLFFIIFYFCFVSDFFPKLLVLFVTSSSFDIQCSSGKSSMLHFRSFRLENSQLSPSTTV